MARCLRGPAAVLVALLCAGSAAAARAGDDRPAPWFHVAEPVLDFGVLRGSDPVERAFCIQNAGDGELRIATVRLGCCGPLPWRPDARIPPGGAWDLPIRITPTGAAGASHRRVLVYTNDPDHEVVALTVRAVERPRFRTGGGYNIMFAPLRPAECRPGGTEIRRRITVDTDEPVEFGPVEVSPPLFTARLERVVTPGDDPPPSAPRSGPTPLPGAQFDLVIAVAADLEPGLHTAAVRIPTGVPSDPELRFTMTAQAPIPVTLRPAQLDLPAERSTMVVRPLLLENNRDEPLEIRAIEIDRPEITYEVRTERPGTQYRIDVQVPPTLDLAASTCIIRVRTSAGDELVARLRQRRQRSEPEPAREPAAVDPPTPPPDR